MAAPAERGPARPGAGSAHGAEERAHVVHEQRRLFQGGEVPAEFSRPEVLEILRAYYASLAEDEKVEVKLSGHSAR